MSSPYDIDKSKMIGGQGTPKTKALFLEMNWGGEDVLFTLSPQHNHEKKLPSIYRLYLDMEDLTEFEFAETYFLGMPHWRRLCETSWFQPHLEQMREDLQTKIKSRALRHLIKEADDPDSRNYFQALKYLSDKGYRDKAQKGRPSKKDIQAQAQLKAEHDAELNDILGRLEINSEPPQKKELN